MGIKKILLTTLGVSATGGIIAGSCFLLKTSEKPKKIKNLLLNEELTFLDISKKSNNNHIGQWAKLVARHNSGGSAPVKLKNGTKIKKIVIKKTQERIDEAKLKEACQELFEKEIFSKEQEIKENAKNWCTLESPLLNEDNFETISSLG